MALLLMFVCLAFCGSVLSEVFLDDCPQEIARDGHLKVFNDSCFEFVLTDLKEYVDAESYCVDNGGHLTSIGSEAENDFIANELHDTFDIRKDVWIGLHDRYEEHSYRWTDGSNVVFFKWDIGHSDTKFWNRVQQIVTDCVVLNPTNGFWTEEHCLDNIFSILSATDTYKPFVCRYKPDVPEDEGKEDDWHADVKTGIDQYTQKCQVVDCGDMDCGMSGFKTDENNCKKCECL